MTALGGAVAPEGYLWARDDSGCWHVLRVADLTDEGGGYRRVVQSACGAWASVIPHQPGHWAELSRWLPAEPHLCSRCLAAEPAIEDSFLVTYVAPAMEQRRLC
jgi:hypothetical protein